MSAKLSEKLKLAEMVSKLVSLVKSSAVRVGKAEARGDGFKGSGVTVSGSTTLSEKLKLAEMVSKWEECDSYAPILVVGKAEARGDGFKEKAFGRFSPSPRSEKLKLAEMVSKS